jgi:hypothetical protein
VEADATIDGGSLEERVRILETRQDAVERFVEERLMQPIGSRKRGWRAIVGAFENDLLYDEAIRLGREWRQSQVVDGSTS